MHKFDPKNMSSLESAERRKKFPPDKILKQLGITSGASVADIGCGIGYFSIPASSLVEPNGMVYALDTSEEMLKELKKRTENIANIKIVHSQEYDFGLESGSVDYVLLVFLLHEVEEKERFINKVKEIIKQNGKIVLIEWQKKPTEGGPAVEDRVAENEAEDILRNSGFTHQKHIELHDSLYCIIASGE